MEERLKFFSGGISLDDVDSMLEEFLDTHFVNSVQFSYTQYDENDSAGVGYRTTIEKCRYAVEDFE